MPTAFVGQNGAEIHESTKIGVAGCPKAKKAVLGRAQKLRAALKACGKEKAKGRRVGCEERARKRYGPVKKQTKAKKKGK